MSGPSLPARGLVLVGYRGSGKSSVGRALAIRLGLPFHDADTALEARHGCTIRRIFEEQGEPVFRERERGIISDITAGPACVLATGGGAVLRPDNRQRLREFGFVVWLSADPASLAARLLGGSPEQLAGRPALTSAGTLEEIESVLAARKPLYREVAHAEVRTDGLGIEQVVTAVLDSLSAHSIVQR